MIRIIFVVFIVVFLCLIVNIILNQQNCEFHREEGLSRLVTVEGLASAFNKASMASASECCLALLLSSATLELLCSWVASRGWGGPRAAATAATATEGLWWGWPDGGPGGGGGGGKCGWAAGPGWPWILDGQQAHIVKPKKENEKLDYNCDNLRNYYSHWEILGII